MLGEPLQLGFGEPRKHDLVVEIGKPLAPNHLRGRHLTGRLPTTVSALSGGGPLASRTDALCDWPEAFVQPTFTVSPGWWASMMRAELVRASRPTGRRAR